MDHNFLLAERSSSPLRGLVRCSFRHRCHPHIAEERSFASVLRMRNPHDGPERRQELCQLWKAARAGAGSISLHRGRNQERIAARKQRRGSGALGLASSCPRCWSDEWVLSAHHCVLSNEPSTPGITVVARGLDESTAIRCDSPISARLIIASDEIARVQRASAGGAFASNEVGTTCNARFRRASRPRPCKSDRRQRPLRADSGRHRASARRLSRTRSTTASGSGRICPTSSWGSAQNTPNGLPVSPGCRRIERAACSRVAPDG